LDHSLQIEIDILLEHLAPEYYIHITIRDNGRGFKQPVLDELRKGNRIVDEQGEHIGIWNVWHRMRLLYGSKARIEFFNADPQGAVVQILLPLQPEIVTERENAQ
jgi:two-component system sensor histidine kinase YesM